MNVFLWPIVLTLAVPSAAQEEPAENPGAVRTVRARDGETIILKVRIADHERNLLSVVTLPDPIAHVVSAWDPKDLSLEHDAKKLFLKLLSKTEGHLDVITTSGTHYRFLVVPVAAPGPYDSNVVVKEGGERQAESGKASARKRTASGALELVKAMRLGEAPADATVRDGMKEVLWTGPTVELTLLYVYETGRFRGIVLGLTNRSPEEAYHVDVTRFTGETLVLIGSKNVIVPPGKATRVYLVEWK